MQYIGTHTTVLDTTMRTYDELLTAVNAANDAYDRSGLLAYAEELEHGDDPRCMALATLARGLGAYIQHDYTEALQWFEQALEGYTAVSEDLGIARALSNIGLVKYINGRESEALEAFTRSLEIHKRCGNIKGIATLTSFVGIVDFGMGNYADALEQYTTSLAMQVEIGNDAEIANTLSNIGLVYETTGDYPTALEYYHKAHQKYEALHDRDGLAGVIGNIGNVQSVTGDLNAAMDSYQLALEIHTERGVDRGVAVVTGNIGSLLVSMNRLDEAQANLNRALELYTSIGDVRGAGTVLGSIASTFIKQGNHDEAQRVLESTTVSDFDNPRTVIDLMESTAKLHDHRGDVASAIRVLTEALALAVEHTLREEQAELHAQLRDLALKQNDLAGYVAQNTAFMKLNEEIRGQEATRRLAMHDAQRRIDAERKEHDKHLAILHSTLPKHVAERVARGEVVNDHYDNAAVLFLDIVGFTTISSLLDPQQVIELLDRVFKECDAICTRNGLTKIKTIGDSYMAVSFAPDAAKSCRDAARAALEMNRMEYRIQNQEYNGRMLEYRIGIHCGPLVAGVIGTERMQYDVWGDTVNIASRMESSGEAGKVQCSEEVESRIKNQESNQENTVSITSTLRGVIDIKGKGAMRTFWLQETV